MWPGSSAQPEDQVAADLAAAAAALPEDVDEGSVVDMHRARLQSELGRQYERAKSTRRHAAAQRWILKHPNEGPVVLPSDADASRDISRGDPSSLASDLEREGQALGLWMQETTEGPNGTEAGRVLSSGAPAYLKVHFRSQSHTWEEDIVKNFPALVTRATLRYLHGKSDEESIALLRPYNMADSMPQLFWALVRHGEGPFEERLQRLVPDLDWDFTERRVRRRTAKAQEWDELVAEGSLEGIPEAPLTKKRGRRAKALQGDDSEDEEYTETAAPAKKRQHQATTEAPAFLSWLEAQPVPDTWNASDAAALAVEADITLPWENVGELLGDQAAEALRTVQGNDTVVTVDILRQEQDDSSAIWRAAVLWWMRKFQPNELSLDAAALSTLGNAGARAKVDAVATAWETCLRRVFAHHTLRAILQQGTPEESVAIAAERALQALSIRYPADLCRFDAPLLRTALADAGCPSVTLDVIRRWQDTAKERMEAESSWLKQTTSSF